MTAPRPLCIACSAEIPPRVGPGRNHVRCADCRAGKPDAAKIAVKPLVKPVAAAAVAVVARTPAPAAVVSPKPVPVAESVDHPTHYHPGTYEAINVIEAWELGFHLGNAVKYIARAGRKGSRTADLRKAVWYLERELARAEVRT